MRNNKGLNRFKDLYIDKKKYEQLRRHMKKIYIYIIFVMLTMLE